MTSRFLLTCLIFLTSSIVRAADTSPVKVSVHLTALGGFDVTSTQLQGRGTKTKNQFAAKELKVPVASLKTGMSLRDQHLREKLDGAKYPVIKVEDVKASDGRGTARITIRDVTKPVPFTFKTAGANVAEASFTLHLPDFKIAGINYRGVGVKDDVEVTVRVPFDGK